MEHSTPRIYSAQVSATTEPDEFNVTLVLRSDTTSGLKEVTVETGPITAGNLSTEVASALTDFDTALTAL